MKCPNCGMDMVPGELATSRGDTAFYWAPKAFFDKHPFNTYSHTRKTILHEGGMLIKANSKVNNVAICYGCQTCQMLVVDCH